MRKTAYMGLFAALAIIFGYVETLLPVFAGIPGIKLGLANLVTVILLYLFWLERGSSSLFYKNTGDRISVRKSVFHIVQSVRGSA